MISDAYRCIFIHVPETAGTSIEVFFTGHDWITRSHEDYSVFLREREGYTSTWGGTLCAREPGYFRERLKAKHADQGALRAAAGPRWESYFKFTVVRDPWERLRSLYRHGLRRHADRMPATLTDWLRQDDPRDPAGQPAFHPFVTDWDELDFTCRFETLGEDFARLIASMGLDCELDAYDLPHVDPGAGEAPPADDARSEYDDAGVEIVARRCAAEIGRFGYRFRGQPVTARA